MKKVLSVDLACCTKDMGVCLLEPISATELKVDFLTAVDLGLSDPLDANITGKALYQFCTRNAIPLAILDGPQAWKNPGSSEPHCRSCERILNTPGKTGPSGIVKPKAYLRFVEFSISVFNQLVECGAKLASSPKVKIPDGSLLALESFPFAAWKKIHIKPLPSKQKCKPGDILSRLSELRKRFGIETRVIPTHDQLQAVVAGLAGVAILDEKEDHYCAVGNPPIFRNGTWVEGFIVCPLTPESQDPPTASEASTRTLTTQQIGRLGELLVQYKLLERGIESAPMTTDAGIDLVAYSGINGRSFTIQVKTNLAPKPGGGKGAPAVDWWVAEDCPAELYAFADVSTRRVWLLTKQQLKLAAQQRSSGRFHLYIYTTASTSSGYARHGDERFSEFLFENCASALFQ